jgi:hypothetical protein
MGESCHTYGMTRLRVSTTVDGNLLLTARAAHPQSNDAALLDKALAALLAQSRATEVDAGYRSYDDHPLDEPDEWGDLASFRAAAAAT